MGDTPELETPARWTMPEGIVAKQVDRRTGLLASDACPADRLYTDYFIPGTEPTGLCDPNADSGGLFGVPLGKPIPDTIARQLQER